MLELNDHFAFHQTLAVDIQFILEILSLNHDILKSDNSVISSVYIFFAVLFSVSPPYPNDLRILVPFLCCPTSGGTVLRPILVEDRCQVQTSLSN